MAKKTITISLYVSELLYDVQNKTYLTGRSRENGDNHEEVAHMKASDDEENGNQILRSIYNAYNTLKSKLSEYLDEDTVAGDNILDGADETGLDTDKVLSLVLKMPSNYNPATVEAVTSGCHQYIVNVAIADWFTITNKADAADYVKISDNNLNQIREAINKRIRPIYHKPTNP